MIFNPLSFRFIKIRGMNFGSQILILNAVGLQIRQNICFVATNLLCKNKEVCISDCRSLYSIPAD